MTARTPRPWYVLDELCDDYVAVRRTSGDLRMLQLLKVIRGITLNASLFAMSIFAILEGADPTLIASIGLIALMIVNGVELGDYLAAKQALEEADHNDE
jgi:hypothetical protein